MKTLLLSCLLLFCISAPAQFYYKDIIGTNETAGVIAAYKTNGVKRVLVNSYDAANNRIQDLYVEQQFTPEIQLLKTITRTTGGQPSVLSAYADAAGRVVKTVDSTGTMVSTTTYQYDNEGRLLQLTSTTSDTARRLNETEQHIWQYQSGQPERMLRIINNIDTTVVSFKRDGQGNVIEEQSTRRGVKAETVYYYYDAGNRLTDVVRYNTKARRLLPEFMFEYSPQNQVIQRITVPANSSDYLIWRYQYDAGGLKTREVIYNKNKEVSGKIEYQYQRS